MFQKAIIPLNNLSRAISRDRSEINSAIAEVLSSGYVLMGPKLKQFETELAEYLNAKDVIGVATGTDALELAIKAAMPTGKTTVITAANAGGYTTTAATRAGFNLVYADVNSDSLCIDLENVKKSMTQDVGVVVITHLYGLLTDFSDLIDFCKIEGLVLIEDTAQALGANRNGVFAGTLGDIGTTSFYPTKNLGALGDGGALFTNSSDLAKKIRSLRQYGWSSKYDVELSGGVNSRLDDVQAAILSIRLPMLNTFNRRRREIISRYREAVIGNSIHVLPADGDHHAGHLAVALSDQREVYISELSKLGIQTDIHFPILDYRQTAWRDNSVTNETAEEVTEQIFSLPCFPEMTEEEVTQVSNALKTISSKL
jgi:dTDP-4-amino-4,6-dideoxygalactose transaminase